MNEPCGLCGNPTRGEVDVSLVRWARPVLGKLFDWMPRCVDRDACRDRVEARPGGVWQVADRRSDVVEPGVPA